MATPDQRPTPAMPASMALNLDDLTLVLPSMSHAASYLAAKQAGYADAAPGFEAPGPGEDGLEAHLASLNQQGGIMTLPDGGAVERVPHAHLWMVAGSRMVGRVSVRYRLNAFLARWGGHIGYEIVPAFRGQGAAHRALALGVAHARARGVGDLLLTCDDTNTASARVIERAGGTLEGVIPHPLEPGRLARRYWIRAGADRAAS